MPWELLGLMELQPPERHTLVNAAHEGLQEGPQYLEQGWEQEWGQLQLNGENNSLFIKANPTDQEQLPVPQAGPREPGEGLAIPNTSW